MAEEYADDGDRDIRRRAAWLLVMLAVVAGLIVVLMVTFLNSSSPSAPTPVGIGSAATSAGTTSSSHAAPRSTPVRRSPTPKSTPTTQGPVTRSCPTKDICILQGDPGDAIKAINAYRRQNNLPAVPGTVSSAAQSCALSNGSNCSGGWAESQVPDLTGSSAVDKIKSLGKLLDPQMKSIGVGWALDPSGPQYYFAIVRND